VTDVTVYTTDWCPYCDRAKSLLNARNVPYREINLDNEPGFRSKLQQIAGRSTVPQIFIGGKPVGGFMELRDLDRAGGLTILARSA
jgi:glutaredoxin 3